MPIIPFFIESLFSRAGGLICPRYLNDCVDFDIVGPLKNPNTNCYNIQAVFQVALLFFLSGRLYGPDAHIVFRVGLTGR